MFSDYFEVREWLENFIPQTYSRKNLGLERIEYLLKLLGSPEKKIKSIHVGGTSGKGSTAFYISEILKEKGFKVGLHLSPHLIYLGERMQINRKEIPVSKLVELINKIKPFVEQMSASQVGKPSYFEILVAASFKYFADEKVDWVVVEVGLGGKYDATNVIKPEVCVITNVGLDHTEILGKSVEKIAYEKAGIIKQGVSIVTGCPSTHFVRSGSLNLHNSSGSSRKALKVIEKVAEQKNAILIKVDTRLDKKHLNSDIFKLTSIYKDIFRDSHSTLAFSNQMLAIAAVSALKIKLDSQNLNEILKERLKGRFEEIDKKIVLDTAHNVDKINFLISNLKIQFTNISNLTLVIAFKKRKDWKKMVHLLINSLPVKKIIVTEFSAPTDMGFFASMRAEKVKNYIELEYRIPTTVYKNSQEAVISAINLTFKKLNANQLVLVTGSLFLVGEARTLWKLPEF